MLKYVFRLVGLAALLLILVLGLNYGKGLTPSTEGTEEPSPTLVMENVNLRSYFPVNNQWEYEFSGEGNEFAPFTREILYTDGVLAQVFDTTGGAMVSTVYRITENEIALVTNPQESESRENVLEQVQRTTKPVDVLLRQPLRPGSSWESRDGQRQIVAVNEIVEVPAGVFHNVVVVEIDYGHDPNVIGYEYYAINIGLIKREYREVNGDFEVISQLNKIVFH